ncbi:MarR family winged helix-turn-helix transcriptional regulator [Lutibacter sp.]|uniref:MarR family winged helix-turn-helix transcriptional regulator n=1 Tax=Lutibacter sp. TaxID=1925666 RepID=UPI0035681358
MNKYEKKDKLNLPGYTIDNILQTGNWMTESYSEHLKQYSLSIQQYQVLRSLRELNGEPTDLLTLSEQMVSKNSNTTRLVEKLRLKKLISRVQNEENRRKVDITITDKGLALLSEIDGIQTEFENRVVANLSETEIKTFNLLLEKIRSK